MIEASVKLMEIAQAQAAAQGGAEAPEADTQSAQKADDDVVDAEFEEVQDIKIIVKSS